MHNSSIKMAVRSNVVFLILSVLILCSNINSVESVEGKLFFLAYIDPSVSTPNAAGFQEIFISCINQDGRVRVEYKPWNKTEIFTLNSTNNWQKSILIYPDLAGPPGTTLPASVIISSEMDISVQTNKAEDGTGDGYLALPITKGSTQFYMASYTPRGKTTELTVAAPYDTCVQVRFVNGSVNYREMYITMPAGTVYHATAADGDYTGLYVTSSKPIAVYGGMDCAYIPYDVPSVASCDHIIEQIPPFIQLGNVFILSSFYGRNPSAGFQYRVVATYTTTIKRIQISYDPTTNQAQPAVVLPDMNIDAGQYAEFSAGRGSDKPVMVLLTCSGGPYDPCMVMQYSVGFDMTKNGNEPNNNKPDEYMITVPDIKHYTKDLTFSTSQYFASSGNKSDNFVSGVTIIAKKSEVGSLLIDGNPLSTLTDAEFADVKFDAATQSQGAPPDTFTVVYGGVTPGFHKITSTNAAAFYTAFVYGASPATTSTQSSGYGYLAGYKYDYTEDSPIETGPWFNFTAPVTPGDGGNNGNGDPVIAPTLDPTDYPNYVTIWEAKFYTLVPTVADLKTRNCSEAYNRYYMEYRFGPMKKYLNETFIPDRCVAGLEMTMNHLVYYSEYTDGLIKFSLSVTSTGNAMMSEIFDCIALVSDHVSDYGNWAPGYKVDTDFLKNDAYYVRGCDVLHMRPPGFESYYFGWTCPTRGGLLGISMGNMVVTSSYVTIACLVTVQLMKLFFTR